MNAELLLAHFRRVSEAPDAVARLRSFILDLAVRGRLVEQDPSDEPASRLLARIQLEQCRLRKSAEVNADLSETVRSEEVPFAIPETWHWARLGERLELINGRAFKPTEWLPRGLPIVRIQNLNDESAPFNYCDEAFVQLKHTIDSGAFLISWSGTPGTSFGAFIWRRGRGALNQHIFTCFQRGEAFCDRFLRLAINGRLDEMIAKAHGGVGLQHITKGKLEYLPLPLPPLPEQHRIVAKVDELMALCDRLVAEQRERESRWDRLTAATHHHLNNEVDAKATRSSAQFFIGHLPRLTARPDQIKQLRQTVLNLAVRGKLVSQSQDEQSPSVWFETLGSNRKRRNGTSQDVRDEFTEAPFVLPNGWIWLQVANVFEVAGGIQKTPDRTPRNNAFPYLGVGNVYRGRLDLREVKKFELADGELAPSPEPSDILIIEGNGSFNEIGRCAIWNGEISDCVHQNHVIRCRPKDIKIARFVLLFLNSPIGVGIMQRLAITSSGLYSLSVGKIREIGIPLPPIPEQYRIVAKVEKLVAICDQLEARLTTAQTEASRLLESVLHHALNSPTPPQVFA